MIAVDAGFGAVLLLGGRILFDGFIAFAGLNHFLNAGEMTDYAAGKGAPAPGVDVIPSVTVLLLGGLGLLGVYPVLAADTIATLFIVVTPLIHGFWAVPEAQKQDEPIKSLKNIELLGAVLVFLALGAQV